MTDIKVLEFYKINFEMIKNTGDDNSIIKILV